MSEPAPELSPIADAFRAAGLVRGAQPPPTADELGQGDTEAELEAERQADIESIKRAFKKKGLKGALSVGKTYGWTKAEVEALFTPPADPPRQERDRERDEDPGDRPDDRGDGAGRPRGRDPTKRPIKPLPEDCPVIPLGMSGRTCWYLNPNGDLIDMTKHGAEDIKILFGKRMDWPWMFYPKWKAGKEDSPPVLYAWEAGYMAESLIEACGNRGRFDPVARLRGVGAWKGDAGELVMHCGDGVLFVPPHADMPHRWEKPGYHGEYVYPGGDRVPRPADEPQDRKPATELLAMLGTWQVQRPPEEEAPPVLQVHELKGVTPEALMLLGWIVQAMIGGAVDWRTHAVVTGSEGTGKSTLQKLVAWLLGGSILSSTDATAAGIYQTVGYSSRAAAVDEAENDPNSPKMKNMVDLVRNASSGGQIVRGSNDANAKAFTSRSAFFLSAIFLPAFSPQDLTRLVKIELTPLARDAPDLSLDRAKLAAMGRALRRRVVDGWPRFEQTLAAYRAGLVDIGHDKRGADQWGALMATADLVLFDHPPDPDSVTDWVEAVGREKLPEKLGNASTSQAMVDYLRTLPMDAFRGGNRQSVGFLVELAAGRHKDWGEATDQSAVNALRTWGIYVVGPKLPGEPYRVVLPNSHTGLSQLLEKTAWGTRPGAATSGWSQAMSRLAGARRENSRQFGGRGYSVPLEVFLGEDRSPADRGGNAA